MHGVRVLSALLACAVAAASGREPVLKQVDLPHNYYWRELYLPQLTTGPSGASFLPDSETLVYSMGGSLWRQRIGDEEAVELTHATGAYDYQPDVARDGRSVVFTRYDGGGLELWRLDLASGTTQALTQGGAVNVEPRLSPDGRRIAWVSTQGTGHFNLFIADIGADGLHNARPLLGERTQQARSLLLLGVRPRDQSLVVAGWQIAAVRRQSRNRMGHGRSLDRAGRCAGRSAASCCREETSWSARPEFAPDGKRIAVLQLPRPADAPTLADDACRARRRCR